MGYRSAGLAKSRAPNGTRRSGRPAGRRADSERGTMATKLAANEITAILERELQGYQADVDLAEVGTVVSVGDGIARIHGLQKCMAGEMLAFPGDVYGLALNLEEDEIGAVLMGETRAVEEGNEV